MVLRAVRDAIRDPSSGPVDDTTQATKATLERLPQVGAAVWAVLRAAPYLIGCYIVIAALDLHHLILPQPTASQSVAAWALSVVLTTAANALCYVEARNILTDAQPISAPGRYVSRRLPGLAAVIALTIAATVIGWTLFVLPGLYLFGKLVLAQPAYIIDDVGVRESLTTSYRETDGHLIFILGSLAGSSLVIFPWSLLLMVQIKGASLLGLVGFLSITPVVIQILLGVLYLHISSQYEWSVDN